MRNEELNFTSPTLYKKLEKISNICFTNREIDIIACIVNGRSAKKIANFLSIAPKTVDNHARNIMLKIRCNSRESIIDFVERSDRSNLLRKHYLDLLGQAYFEHQLKNFRVDKGVEAKVFLIVYNQELHNQENILIAIHKIAKHLELIGFSVHLEVQDLFKFSKLLPILEKYKVVNYILWIFSNSNNLSSENFREKINIDILQFVRSTHKNIFILLENKTDFSTSNKILDEENINYFELENYYLSFFELLKKFFCSDKINRAISQFKAQHEILCNSSNSITNNPLSDKENDFFIKKIFRSLSRNVINHSKYYFFILILLTTSILYRGIKTLGENRAYSVYESIFPSKLNNIRTDLIIPIKDNLLERTRLIEKIDKAFKREQEIKIVAITGIGGSGKTTVARQYGKYQKASIVWEINAENHESLINSFENLALALSKTKEDQKILQELQVIKNSKDKEHKQLIFVKEKLKFFSDWFLIYDNLKSIGEIQEYFPCDSNTWGKGKALIVTRDENVKNNNQVDKVINIGRLSDKEKIFLFLNIIKSKELEVTPSQELQTEKFLNNLPPFPLDISIAAYYIKATNISYEDYLRHLKNHNEDFENTQGNIMNDSSGYKDTRCNIIKLSLASLLEISQDWLELLLLISLLDSQSIPLDLLNDYRERINIDNFIYNLKKYSLISEVGSNFPFPTISIHQNTQEIIFCELMKKLNLDDKHRLINLVSNIFIRYVNNLIEEENLIKMKSLINHIETFLRDNNFIKANTKAYIEGQLGIIFSYLGKYNKAKLLIKKSINKLEENFIDNRLFINKLQIYEGIIFYELAEYEKAKLLLEKSLSTACLKEDYNGKSQALAYLGNVNRAIGNKQEAIDMLECSVKIYNEHFPNNHSKIALILLHLGVAYRSIGKYNKAQALLEKSLYIYKKYLPNDYVSIPKNLIYLGILYREKGEHKKAKYMLEQGYKIYINNFSEDYLKVAWVLANLGVVHRELCNYEEAQKLLEKSLVIYKKYLFAHHLDVAWTLANLGNVYYEQGNLIKAKELLEESLETYKKQSSISHPRVARILMYLGKIYAAEGKYEKAKTYFKNSLNFYEQKYGKEHVKTARVLMNLGYAYFLKGKIKFSEKTIEKALNIFLEHNHSDAYICLEILSDIYLYLSLEQKKSIYINHSRELIYKAINFLQQSLKIMKQNFPSQSSKIKKTQYKLNELFISYYGPCVKNEL